MTSWRVPASSEQGMALLEAASMVIESDTYVAKQLLSLAISVFYSEEQGWEWRMKDEDV